MFRVWAHILFVALMMLAAPAWCGTDVSLRAADGHLLTKAELGRADMATTCGDCHDVSDKAASTHFNRGSEPADRQFECLTCHISQDGSAISSDGTISKLSARPQDGACLSCHSEISDERLSGIRDVHAGLACVDCHRGVEHRLAAPASCTGCHSGQTSAPRPIHRGFTRIHFARLACEACHAAVTGQKTHSLAVAGQGHKIFPINGDGSYVHHGIAPASLALGGRGCTDCHTMRADSLFLSITSSRGGRSGRPSRFDAALGGFREAVLKPGTGWVIGLVILACTVHWAVFGPRRVKTVRGEPMLERFSVPERVIHALAVTSFAFLATTGLMLLMRLDTPFGPWRAVHGRVGGLFGVCVLGVVVIWCRHARFCSSDRVWLRQLGGYFRKSGTCPAGRFNAGQKLFFWAIPVGAGAVISVTGLMLLAGRGEAAAWIFTIHDLAALAMILGILGHVYLSVIANPGALRGILTGRVPESWARHHHSEWVIKHPSSRNHSGHSDGIQM